MNIDGFVTELEKDTMPSDSYRSHEGTLIRGVPIAPDTFRVQEFISFNGTRANKTGKWLCALADKWQITLIGVVRPFLVGPSIIKENLYYQGMPLERMLKWYQHYGFIAETINDKTQITRKPKNESYH